MKIHQVFAVGCAVGLLWDTAQAAPPTSAQEAIDRITADSKLLSGWISDQFVRAIPFNSTAGNVVPSQLKIFGIEVGAEAVVSGTKLDTNAFHSLGTTIVDTTKIDTFDRLPIPMVLGHAKIGLPFGFDAGIRLGGIPSTSYDKGSTHIDVSNSVFGLDLRKKLIEEGTLHPFGLTAGINFTRAKGHINATTPYNVQSGDPNVTFSNVVGAARTDWDTKSVGVQLIANKKILILNPYIGVAANKYFGSVDTTISNSGMVSVIGDPSSPRTLNTQGSGSASPTSGDLRAMAGLETTFLPFCKLGIGGEIATGNNLAGTIGLRIQFR